MKPIFVEIMWTAGVGKTSVVNSVYSSLLKHNLNVHYYYKDNSWYSNLKTKFLFLFFVPILLVKFLLFCFKNISFKKLVKNFSGRKVLRFMTYLSQKRVFGKKIDAVLVDENFLGSFNYFFNISKYSSREKFLEKVIKFFDITGVIVLVEAKPEVILQRRQLRDLPQDNRGERKNIEEVRNGLVGLEKTFNLLSKICKDDILTLKVKNNDSESFDYSVKKIEELILKMNAKT